jgi:hypothetical protein
VNIAGVNIDRTDIAAAVVGSALGIALAVVPGLVGQHHSAGARSADTAPSVAGSGSSSSSTPTPPPRCDLPVAESSTDAAATAESWSAVYLSGPTADCPLAGWRHALNSAAGGQQVSLNRYAEAPSASRVVGSAVITQCTAMLCSSDTKADLLTIPVTPDPTVSGSDQATGKLRLNLEQQVDGRWLVTGSMFTPASS